MNAKTGNIEADPQHPMNRQADAQQAPAKRRNGLRRLLMAAVPLAFALAGLGFWLFGGRYVTTDNAYIHQPMVAISADVSGRIVEVDVTENQQVATGATLFRIDPEPYRIALDKAEASLAAARLGVSQTRAQYATAEAQLAAYQSVMEVQNRELDRQKALTQRGVGSAADFDEATVAQLAAKNNAAVARRQLEAAAAALGGDPQADTDSLPSVRAAIAARDAAQRDLDKTVVKAPLPGVVAQVESLNPGQYVGAGTEIATLVDAGDMWIEANFKETQLDGIALGQPVTIEIDAYPDLELHGSVESFGAATGSQYSLIPAQNATGNWVKVVQRLSVRIRIEDAPADTLRDGMSVTVSVDTGHSHLDDLM
ncbi:HlyD family secretion protein [Sulfitobacter sp. LCG007]